MKLFWLIVVASLCCACTAGGPSPGAEQEAEVERALEPAPEPTPPAPSLGFEAETKWFQFVGELGDEEFWISLPQVLTREPLPRRAGTRWRYLPEVPDGQSLMVTVHDGGGPRPATLEDARARLDLDGLEELEAREDADGVLFVHADHKRTMLVINYFTTLGERPASCSVSLQRDVPAPDFDAARRRYVESCLGMRWQDPNLDSAIGLGKVGLIGPLEAAPAGGRLCARPYLISSTPGKGAQTADDPEANAAKQAAARERLERGLAVAIDGGERQPWTRKKGFGFEGLDLAEAHTVEIFATGGETGGERLGRVKLDFEARRSDEVCLGHDSFYGTWQLRRCEGACPLKLAR